MVIQNKRDLCAFRPPRRIKLLGVENGLCFVLNPPQRIELNFSAVGGVKRESHIVRVQK